MTILGAIKEGSEGGIKAYMHTQHHEQGLASCFYTSGHEGPGPLSHHPVALAHSTKAAIATLFPVPVGPRRRNLLLGASPEPPAEATAALRASMLWRYITACERVAASSS